MNTSVLSFIVLPHISPEDSQFPKVFYWNILCCDFLRVPSPFGIQIYSLHIYSTVNKLMNLCFTVCIHEFFTAKIPTCQTSLHTKFTLDFQQRPKTTSVWMGLPLKKALCATCDSLLLKPPLLPLCINHWCNCITTSLVLPITEPFPKD